MDGIALNKMIGKAFEEMAIVGVNQLKLSSIGWRPVFPNAKKMKSELRSVLTNGKVRNVIPDGIGSVSVWYIKAPEFPKLINNELKTYNRSSFYEVKAYDGTLHLSSNDYQISAYIDIARKSPAGKANNPHLRPNITFITTSNTVIGNDIITEANAMGVDIFQITTAVDMSDGAIYMCDPVKLTQTGGIDASMLMFDFFTGFYFDINYGLIPEPAGEPDPEILQKENVKK